MFDVLDLASSELANAGVRRDSDGREPTLDPQATRNRAIRLLMNRGFIYLGEDPIGLPCYRSPSGAILIAVGSCRALAYADVGGRLQVVAAVRTAVLVCRIGPPIIESLRAPGKNMPAKSRSVLQRRAAMV